MRAPLRRRVGSSPLRGWHRPQHARFARRGRAGIAPLQGFPVCNKSLFEGRPIPASARSSQDQARGAHDKSTFLKRGQNWAKCTIAFQAKLEGLAATRPFCCIRCCNPPANAPHRPFHTVFRVCDRAFHPVLSTFCDSASAQGVLELAGIGKPCRRSASAPPRSCVLRPETHKKAPADISAGASSFLACDFASGGQRIPDFLVVMAALESEADGAGLLVFFKPAALLPSRKFGGDLLQGSPRHVLDAAARDTLKQQ